MQDRSLSRQLDGICQCSERRVGRPAFPTAAAYSEGLTESRRSGARPRAYCFDLETPVEFGLGQRRPAPQPACAASATTWVPPPASPAAWRPAGTWPGLPPCACPPARSAPAPGIPTAAAPASSSASNASLPWLAHEAVRIMLGGQEQEAHLLAVLQLRQAVLQRPPGGAAPGGVAVEAVDHVRRSAAAASAPARAWSRCRAWPPHSRCRTARAPRHPCSLRPRSRFPASRMAARAWNRP